MWGFLAFFAGELRLIVVERNKCQRERLICSFAPILGWLSLSFFFLHKLLFKFRLCLSKIYTNYISLLLKNLCPSYEDK